MNAAQCRLHGIVARDAPVAVIFRRGPSKHVLLISWNFETDEFSIGQWFKGRVYERRCDLSPSGDLLLYFAANQKPPHYSWSAISRPPYLTALAFWPVGDTYGGGGLFRDDTIIELDRPFPLKLAEGFELPSWLRIEHFGARKSWAEDDAVWRARLERDGWQNGAGPVWEKAHPLMPDQYKLRMTLRDRNHVEYELVRGTNAHLLDEAEWADWDWRGDLLFATRGVLSRLTYANDALASDEHVRVIADFSSLTFEPLVSPPEARVWPTR